MPTRRLEPDEAAVCTHPIYLGRPVRIKSYNTVTGDYLLYVTDDLLDGDHLFHETCVATTEEWTLVQATRTVA